MVSDALEVNPVPTIGWAKVTVLPVVFCSVMVSVAAAVTITCPLFCWPVFPEANTEPATTTLFFRSENWLLSSPDTEYITRYVPAVVIVTVSDGGVCV